jgi:hypothetical protein
MRANLCFSPKSAPAPRTCLRPIICIASCPFTLKKNIGSDAVDQTVSEFDKHDNGAMNHTRLHLENTVRNKVAGERVKTVVVFGQHVPVEDGFGRLGLPRQEEV